MDQESERTETFFIKQVGCYRTRLDCERIRNYLMANRLKHVPSPEQADYIIISTCGLSEFHKNASFDLILASQKYQGTLVVYGCLPSMETEEMGRVFDGVVIPTNAIDRFDCLFPDFLIKFSEVPDANLQFEEPKVSMKERVKTGLSHLDLYYPLRLYSSCMIVLEKIRERIHSSYPSLFSAPLIDRVPIFAVKAKDSQFSLRVLHGCLGNCSYCTIKRAIGSLISKSVRQLLEEVTRGLVAGYEELNVVSSDTGSYGFDIESTLPELLEAILALDERITIGTLQTIGPIWINRYRSELIDIIRTRRIKSLLTPIQSGSPRVLSLMNREVDMRQFILTVKEMKRAYPRLRLRTQVIVGFPTETEQDFQDTIDVVRECEFDEVDISQYYETDAMASARIHPKTPMHISMNRIRKMQMSLPPQTITHPLYEGKIHS